LGVLVALFHSGKEQDDMPKKTMTSMSPVLAEGFLTVPPTSMFLDSHARRKH